MSSTSDTALLIQARHNSSRLPGKVLKTIGGHAAMLGVIAKRLSVLDYPVVIVTSEEPTDDPIADFCEAHQIAYFRGSLNDVLGRFTAWLNAHPHVTRCVRLTGDNPLVDAALIHAALDAFDARDKTSCHSVSNHLPGHRTDPYGYAAEVVDARALTTLAAHATAPDLREHVTLSFVRAQQVAPFTVHQDAPDLRWTVDTPEDFAYVDQLLKACGADVTAEDAIAWSARHPHPQP